VGLPAPVGAEAQLPLAAPAGQLTEPHRPCTLPKEGTARGSQRPTTAQFPAGHCSIPKVPSVITHGAPAPTVPDFQAAGTAVGAISQA
jgi:hypothetical protein